MANDQNFQATVVAGIETPGAAEAAKNYSQLLRVVDQLEGSAKTAGIALVQSFSKNEAPELLASKIRILQRELKFLGTVGKATELFKDGQVGKINEIQRAIAAAARANETMRQNAAMANYELGLESKTTAEAARNMKVLETNMKATNMALTNDPSNKTLQQKKQLLTDNHALLQVVIEDLKKQAAAQKQVEIERNRQTQSAAAAGNLNALNATGDRAEQLRKRRAQEIGDKLNSEGERQLIYERRITERKRREAEGSASYGQRMANAQLDYSDTGRAYAEQQMRLRLQRIGNSLLPGQEGMNMTGANNRVNAGYMNQVYRDAGMAPSSFAATLKDGPKIKQLFAEIKTIESSIVSERKKGNINLQEEARLLEEIRLKATRITNARRDQALNDPETRQAKQDTQSRNMLNRASGEGGAALLAVQASLMANYSLLNGFVGGIRAAISTSVELEAAFRNVQAVTATSGTEMAGLEDKIKSVAAASKFSSLEVANAALILGQAGLSAKQVGEALEPVVMLASAAGTSIAQAVDLVTSIIGVFDKKTTDIADIANKVTQAANSSKVSVEKLALAFQYVGNAASQVGVSFEETTAALAAMSNAGIKSGSTMGTGLRQFLTETEKPSQEFIATLRRIGLSIADIDFKSHGLIGVTEKLREAGFVASDAIKSFDVRGAAAFNAMIANPQEMERQYRLLMDTQAGVAANVIQMDSLKSQSTRLTTSLGNLASAGFEPLSKILAQLVGAWATVAQAMSEHNVLVGIAGTAIAALLATGAVSFLANMAAGALRLAAGAGAASVAVTALQTASKAGSLGVLMTSIYSTVAGLTLIPPAAGAATVATFTLTGALNALKVAFMSLSIVSGIGLAIAGATAAFYAYQYIMGRSAEETDKLRAATSTAKGAFEEKDAIVSSLSKKIDELSYKQINLRGNTEALKTESLALTSQFGSIGYQSDLNNTSFETMIGKLKRLKDEMAGIRKQSLENALAANETLLKKQTTELQDKVRAESSGNVFSGSAYSQLGNLGYYGKLTGAEQAKIESARGQIKNNNPEQMGDVTGALLIVQRLAANLGNTDRSKYRLDSDSKKLDGLVAALTGISQAVSSANLTRSESAGFKTNLDKTENYNAFNSSGRFGVRNEGGKLVKRTFEESLPEMGNLEIIARKNNNAVDEKDAAVVYELVKAERIKRAAIYKAREKQLNELVLSGQITQDTADTAQQKVKFRQETENNMFLKQADATKNASDRKYKLERRLLMAQQRNARINGDKDLQIEVEKKLGELETTNLTRGETDPDRIGAIREDRLAITEQNIDNIIDRKLKGRTPRDNNPMVQERSLKVQADALDAAADEQKSSIKTAQSIEAINKLMDDAIANRFAAKEKRMKALAIKQGEDAKNPLFDKVNGELAQKLERQAAAAAEDSKINTFADSFISLIETAMGRLDVVTKRINETKRKISEDKMDSEDRVFAAQQALRETELAIALGKKVKPDIATTTRYTSGPTTERLVGKKTDSDGEVSYPVKTMKFPGFGATTTIGPNGTKVSNNANNGSASAVSNAYAADNSSWTPNRVSGVIRESLNQRRNRLIVESAAIELAANEKELEAYGDETTGLIGDLGLKYRTAKETAKTLREKLQTETNEAVKAAMQAQLEVADKTEKESFKDYRQARGEKQKLQVDNFTIQKKVAENTEALPEEVTIDSLMSKLDDLWSKYQSTVGQMNVMKVVSDGLSGIMGSLNGSLGNAFSSIVTGTKSVTSAFKDMAVSIIKAMVDILAQAVAMQAVKGLIGLVGMGVSMGAGAGGEMTTFDIPDTIPMNSLPAYGVASGGLILPNGVQRMAAGGSVRGGISGRDSVPTMLMPGEFVVKESAVNAVGTDYLHSLNSMSNTVTSASTGAAQTSGKKSDSDGVVNVYVVSPDQVPAGMGPKDVVAAISDDIMRGGSVKKLIKSVMLNQV